MLISTAQHQTHGDFLDDLEQDIKGTLEGSATWLWGCVPFPQHRIKTWALHYSEQHWDFLGQARSKVLAPLLQRSSYCRAICPTSACRLHDTQHTIKGNSLLCTSTLHGLADYAQIRTHINLHIKSTESGYMRSIFSKMDSASNSTKTYLPARRRNLYYPARRRNLYNPARWIQPDGGTSTITNFCIHPSHLTH
jgi:hypothetical protein